MRGTMPFLFAAALLLFAADVARADNQAFTPGGPTVSLAVTGTTGRVQVQSSAGGNMRVFNSGTVPVFIACGDVNVTAAAASAMPIAAGTVEVIGCSQQYVAGISGGTAATLYLTPGFGL
jgi:hypothetical protein